MRRPAEARGCLRARRVRGSTPPTPSFLELSTPAARDSLRGCGFHNGSPGGGLQRGSLGRQGRGSQTPHRDVGGCQARGGHGQGRAGPEGSGPLPALGLSLAYERADGTGKTKAARRAGRPGRMRKSTWEAVPPGGPGQGEAQAAPSSEPSSRPSCQSPRCQKPCQPFGGLRAVPGKAYVRDTGPDALLTDGVCVLTGLRAGQPRPGGPRRCPVFWGRPSTAHPMVQAGTSFLSSAGGTGVAAEGHGEDPPQGCRARALPTPCSTGHFPSLKTPVLLARLTPALGSPLRTAPADSISLRTPDVRRRPEATLWVQPRPSLPACAGRKPRIETNPT